MKKDLTKIFINDIYSKAPRKNYGTNTIKDNHIDEPWSIDLADMIDYKISNIKGLRYIFIIFDNFQIICGLYHLKIILVKLSQMNFQIF